MKSMYSRYNENSVLYYELIINLSSAFLYQLFFLNQLFLQQRFGSQFKREFLIQNLFDLYIQIKKNSGNQKNLFCILYNCLNILKTPESYEL